MFATQIFWSHCRRQEDQQQQVPSPSFLDRGPLKRMPDEGEGKQPQLSDVVGEALA